MSDWVWSLGGGALAATVFLRFCGMHAALSTCRSEALHVAADNAARMAREAAALEASERGESSADDEDADATESDARAA